MDMLQNVQRSADNMRLHEVPSRGIENRLAKQITKGGGGAQCHYENSASPDNTALFRSRVPAALYQYNTQDWCKCEPAATADCSAGFKPADFHWLEWSRSIGRKRSGVDLRNRARSSIQLLGWREKTGKQTVAIYLFGFFFFQKCESVTETEQRRRKTNN